MAAQVSQKYKAGAIGFLSLGWVLSHYTDIVLIVLYSLKYVPSQPRFGVSHTKVTNVQTNTAAY